MSLADAVRRAGAYPAADADRADKKRYSELLSAALAQELAAALRGSGFDNVHPKPGGPGERSFQGGLGPKRVDVTYSDEQHGLLLGISVKTITAPKFGKNLKNRFADLCTEAITLHMRFPYAVVCALFAFPEAAERDHLRPEGLSTFRRAMMLFRTIAGRREYTDPGEKFEQIAVMLFNPVTADGQPEPNIRLFDVETGASLTEEQYIAALRRIYNNRNPHAVLEEIDDDGESE